MTCVNSAGNEGDDPWFYIITPADADSVISVGAVRQNGMIASFSSHGPTSDGRIKPEVCALGVNTYCVRSNTENIYRTASGTSFSAPLVAGAVAVILSANNSWTNMQVREALMMTASQNANADYTYGHGIINTWAAINYQHTVSTKNENFIPNNITVNKAFPNPFNPSLSMTIECSTKNVEITTNVYNVQGQLVEILHDEILSNKTISLLWNASAYANGIYFIRTYWDGGNDIQKVTLLN